MTNLEKYAIAVLDGKIIACDKIKREYERLLDDLKNPREYHFDERLATRPWKFIETFCRQSQGQLGSALKLELYQKAMLEAAYGFVDDNDVRRFSEILNIIARKNGKTTLLSAIQIYMLTADHEGAPECYCIATKKEQAAKGYVECCNMVSQSTSISRHVRKRQSDLYCDVNKGFIKALASNTNGLDGLNSHCVVIDELAAIKNRDLYDLMKQSMSSRRQPMLWCITTNGFVRNGIFDAQYDYATGVINGTIKDDHFLPIIYELDSRTEWTDPKMWIKANPGLGTIKKKDKLQANVEKAKADDTFLPTLLVKDFNLKETSDSAWLSWNDLDNPDPLPDDLQLRYGIGGIDAADSVDLNAAKMIGMRQGDNRLYVYQMYWIPQSKVDQTKDRRHPDDVPYDIWEARGLLRVVPGNRVDKHVFLEWFREMRDERDIYPYAIGYDPWHIDPSLVSEFEMEFGKGIMMQIRQGVKTLSQPMKDLKAALQAKEIVYGNNPIDKWCLSNTYVKADINDNIQPVKDHQSQRIDGTLALIDAYVVFRDHREEYMTLI